MRGKRSWAACAALGAVIVLAAPAAAADPVPQGDISVEATAAGGTAVDYPQEGFAADGCTPASGNAFALGATTVSCTSPMDFTFTVTVVDRTSPVFGATPDLSAEATSAAGATVDFVPPASDLFLAGVSCDHGLGSPFPLGSTPVHCMAVDTSGNSSEASFAVKVVDSTSPVFGATADLSAEATSAAGATVDFVPAASDLFLAGVSCDHGLGSPFPLGSTPVHCTATDTSGNSSEASFTVKVLDTTKPVLGQLPAPAAVEATSGTGAIVTYTAPAATDIFNVNVVCVPASGSKFALGATTVSCTATDANRNASSGSFTVNVRDTTPPVVAVPSSITATAPDSSGAVIVYAATAVDVVDGPVVVTCAPASGTKFAVGATKVTCNAVDAAKNAAVAKTFTVTVNAPPADPASPSTPSPPPVSAPFVPPTVALAPVTGLAAKPGNARVVLSWHAPANGLQVELSRSLGTGSPKTIYSGKASTFTDAGLRNGVRYTYAIVAFDANGNRSKSAAVAATPQASKLVSPAQGATVASAPTLLWVPVAGASYYNVQIFRDGAKILSIWPGSNHLKLKRHWVFSGRRQTLAPGSYTWYVWPGYGPHKAKKYGSALGSSSFHLTG